MAVTAYVYGNFMKNVLSGKVVDWINHPIKVMLCSSAYVPNQDLHQTKADVTGEVTGTGYIAGGAALATKTITYDAATNATILDADDVVWPNATITARYAVIYDDNGATDADKLLLGYVDFGQDISSTNGDFKIVWDAGGIFRFTTS
jgi:hypothetical protein